MRARRRRSRRHRSVGCWELAGAQFAAQVALCSVICWHRGERAGRGFEERPVVRQPPERVGLFAAMGSRLAGPPEGRRRSVGEVGPFGAADSRSTGPPLAEGRVDDPRSGHPRTTGRASKLRPHSLSSLPTNHAPHYPAPRTARPGATHHDRRSPTQPRYVAGVPMTASSQQIELHGQPVTYHRMGDGPAVLLIHGITSSSRTWRTVMPALAEHYTVIAPDLLGHGRSAKPRGDYSLGAYASGLRDLLVALEIPRATVVGHSLGGGVAMQFAYQFPERVERLVLIDSGGLGAEVSLVLRAATLPGAEYVLPLLASGPLRGAGAAVGSVLGRVGLRARADVRGMAEGFESLGDADARRAFVHTARSVIDPAGQRVNATRSALPRRARAVADRVGREGPDDPGHARPRAPTPHMPDSRLEIFEGAGPLPVQRRARRASSRCCGTSSRRPSRRPSTTTSSAGSCSTTAHDRPRRLPAPDDDPDALERQRRLRPRQQRRVLRVLRHRHQRAA